MTEESHRNCVAGLEARSIANDLSGRLIVLERRADAVERDKVRLGERVSASEARMDEHEAVNREALNQMNRTLHNLSRTVENFSETVNTILSAPPVPTGIAALESWRATPFNAKAKIGGAIIAVLTTTEFIKPVVGGVLSALGLLLKRWFHIP